jgi:hypothetical protein
VQLTTDEWLLFFVLLHNMPSFFHVRHPCLIELHRNEGVLGTLVHTVVRPNQYDEIVTKGGVHCINGA